MSACTEYVQAGSHSNHYFRAKLNDWKCVLCCHMLVHVATQNGDTQGWNSTWKIEWVQCSNKLDTHTLKQGDHFYFQIEAWKKALFVRQRGVPVWSWPDRPVTFLRAVAETQEQWNTRESRWGKKKATFHRESQTTKIPCVNKCHLRANFQGIVGKYVFFSLRWKI